MSYLSWMYVYFFFLYNSVHVPRGHMQVVNWAKRYRECEEGTLCLDQQSLYRSFVVKQGPVGVYVVGPVG